MMTIEELDGIVKLRNLRKIEKALKAAGFIDCKTDETLKHVNLVPVIQSKFYQKTNDYPAGKYKKYTGSLHRDVQGWERYEFVLVQFLKPVRRGSDIISTAEMLVYAREIQQ